MLEVGIVVLLAIGGLWGVAALVLRGETLRGLDGPTGERFSSAEQPGPELQAVIARLGGMSTLLKGVPMRQRNAVLRRYMDELFADRVLAVRQSSMPARRGCSGISR